MTEQIESLETGSIIWPDDGKEMIFIAGGSFEMGSDNGPENCRPKHKVSIGDFYIDRWPVTNAEYKEFIDATGHHVPNYDVPWCDTTGYNWDATSGQYPPGRGHHPVVLVTWEDACEYAAWANKRLPTEAEWERAARSSDSRIWPWGNEFQTDRCNTAEAHLKGTSPITRFSPQGETPEGVIDMVGNVWEWTSSIYIAYPYNTEDGREDLQSERWRSLRGASWTNDASMASSLVRLDGDFLFYNNVGFRCVVSVE